MNRKDFCLMLDKAKKQSQISTTQLSFDMKMLLPTLRRFEKGEHNFGMLKVMQYLSVINADLVLVSPENIEHTFVSYEDLLETLISIRKKCLSQRQLAEVVGMTYVSIANIERKSTTLKVDVFLKILDTLNYTVKIVNK